MEGLRFIKILFSFSILILIIFFISCQSPLFQTPYETKNDFTNNAPQYGKYVSKNQVGLNPNEKLNVYITNENNIGIFMWIGGLAIPTDDRIDVNISNIDGEYPHYAFNNEEVVGKLTIISKNIITISFSELHSPYLKLQNITCNRIE